VYDENDYIELDDYELYWWFDGDKWAYIGIQGCGVTMLITRYRVRNLAFWLRGSLKELEKELVDIPEAFLLWKDDTDKQK